MSKTITAEHREWYYDTELPEKLIEAATSPRDRAFISLLAKTGVRITQAIQIKVNDIDSEKEMLSIVCLKEPLRTHCPECGERLGRKHLFCPTCGNKVVQPIQDKIEERRHRTIPVDRPTLALIEEYLRWRRRFSYQGPLLFPFTRQRGWQLVERVGRHAGLRGLHPESLRNLLAARWVNKGLNVKKLRFLMGYASTAMQPPNFSFEQVKSEYQKLWGTGQDEA